MVAECHTCEAPLDDQDIANAGMEEICYQCWEERNKESNE